MAFLTDRTLATGTTLQDLVHIVITGDTSQGNSAGSSYKATIKQLFDSITGYCISDLYVTNVHGCSPVTHWDDTYFLSGTIIQSPTPTTYTGFTSGYTGFSTIFDINNPVLHVVGNINNGNEAYSALLVGNNQTKQGAYFGYHSTGFTRTIPSNTGTAFYRNKIVIRSADNTNGTIINPQAGTSNATLWLEMNGSATTKFKGDGNLNTTAYLGLGLNFDGTEDPTATLQVGGTGNTATFKYVDGNQQSGYVLTSDNNGNATWQQQSGFQYYTAVTVTTSEILNIDISPVPLLPAPGSNKYYDFKVYYEYTYGTTPYLGSSIVIKDSSLIYNLGGANLNINGVVNNSVNIGRSTATGGFPLNLDLVLTTTGGPLTGGDGTMKIKIYYNIVTFG
jgi:hypothetical protein